MRQSLQMGSPALFQRLYLHPNIASIEVEQKNEEITEK